MQFSWGRKPPSLECPLARRLSFPPEERESCRAALSTQMPDSSVRYFAAASHASWRPAACCRALEPVGHHLDNRPAWAAGPYAAFASITFGGLPLPALMHCVGLCCGSSPAASTHGPKCPRGSVGLVCMSQQPTLALRLVDSSEAPPGQATGGARGLPTTVRGPYNKRGN